MDKNHSVAIIVERDIIEKLHEIVLRVEQMNKVDRVNRGYRVNTIEDNQKYFRPKMPDFHELPPDIRQLIIKICAKASIRLIEESVHSHNRVG